MEKMKTFTVDQVIVCRRF